jgi:hypothetical protein
LGTEARDLMRLTFLRVFAKRLKEEYQRTDDRKTRQSEHGEMRFVSQRSMSVIT